MLRADEMHRLAFVLSVVVSTTLALALGCESDPDATPAFPDAGPPTDPGSSGNLPGDTGTTEPPTTEPLADAIRIRFVEAPFGSAGCVRLQAVTLERATRDMTVETCADGGADAGTSTRTLTITEADLSGVLDLLRALQQGPAPRDGGCSGNDGMSYAFELEMPPTQALSRKIVVRHQHNCSAPPFEVLVASQGFLALRDKLLTLAGLPTTIAP